MLVPYRQDRHASVKAIDVANSGGFDKPTLLLVRSHRSNFDPPRQKSSLLLQFEYRLPLDLGRRRR